MNEQSESDTVEDHPALRAVSLPLVNAYCVDVAGQTHVGRVRTTNEDHFHIVEFGRYLHTLSSSLPVGEVSDEHVDSGYALAVADGVGGHAGGETASRVAISLLVECALQTPDWILGQEEELLNKVMDRFAQRFKTVNLALQMKSSNEPALEGMGTTLSVALNFKDNLLVAHVGDSRVCLIRGDRLIHLTRDHTARRFVSDPTHPDRVRFRRVLTRAVGLGDFGGDPDLFHYKLEDGDRLLLCTDGLTDMVDDDSVCTLMRQASTAVEACQSLIDIALEHGGRDNVTAIVAIYRKQTGTEPTASE